MLQILKEVTLTGATVTLSDLIDNVTDGSGTIRGFKGRITAKSTNGTAITIGTVAQYGSSGKTVTLLASAGVDILSNTSDITLLGNSLVAQVVGWLDDGWK